MGAGRLVLGLVTARLLSVVSIDPRFDPPRSQLNQTNPSQTESSPGPPMTHEIYCALWRVDDGFVSTIRIKNSLVVAPIDVTPVLYMADGTAYALPPVHLPISGVAAVNVNAALTGAPPEIARRLSGFGSAALRYKYATPGHVLGSVEILDLARSLIYTYPFSGIAEAGPGAQTMEGLWWRHTREVGGFVSVANVTAAPVSVSVEAIGSGGTALPPQLFALSPHATRLFDLDVLAGGLPWHENQAGGLRVEYEGREGDVIMAGGLVNERIGYSANMPFVSRAHHEGDMNKITYASVGIMVGDAESAAGFPAGTRFTPYAALRNTTANPLTVKLTVNYMTGPEPVTRALPTARLAPYETRYLTSELFETQGPRTLNGMINLSASFDGRAGDLLLASGSLDQSGSYVLAVEPQGVGRSSSKEGHYWKVADGFDTMFTLWNPTDQAEDFVVTFFFGQQGAQYKLPVTLGRNASTTIDVSKLIAAQQPDQDGNVIPFGTREGSMAFSSAKGMTEWMTLAISIGILNVQAATCGSECTNCCGYTAFRVTPDPACCPRGLTAQCNAQATYCNGVVYTFTASSSWGSSNTSIVTVNNTTQKGLVTGVSDGTATVSARFPLSPVYTGCIGGGLPCPTGTPQVGGSVQVVSATIGSLTAVGKNQTASVSVTLSPSPTQCPVTLALSTTTGTGSAQFVSNNSTTLSISQSTSVDIKGITESSTANNIRLRATIGNQLLAARDFTVLWVTLSLRNSGTVSTDNGASSAYLRLTGGTNLGTFFSVGGTAGRIWGTGVEVVGTVKPSNFSGSIILRRAIVSVRSYNNMTEKPSSSQPGDDTSDPPLRDDDPQSGGSVGKVFDLDFPRLGTLSATPVGTIFRWRINFRQWAEFGTQKVSGDLNWFSRLSIRKPAFGGDDVLHNDVSGDNVAGSGTTALTWNLQ